MEFKALGQSNITYELQWKNVAVTWDSLSSIPVKVEAGTVKRTEATPLEPGTTYCVRLSVKDETTGTAGTPGPELIIDTEQVGCTPQASKSCCVVL